MMKKLLELLLFCSLISAPFMVSAQHWNEQEGRYYDGHSRYEGRIDSNGRMYDNHGRYKGRIDSNGRHYDEHAISRKTGR